MLLAGVGTLNKHGLICERCDKKPSLKASLGCLKKPLVTFKDFDGVLHEEVEWSIEFLRDYLAEVGMDLTGEAAQLHYPYAPLGDIYKYIPGAFWDCCPRSYAEFTSQDIRTAADSLVNAAMDIRSGVPSTWILGGAQPTAQAKKIIRMCLRFLDVEQNKINNGEGK